MKRIAFFDTKPYDRTWFDALNTKYEIDYFEIKLNERTAVLTKGFDGVIAFVNDEINEKAINTLVENGVKVIAMRRGLQQCGYQGGGQKITIVRVPAYSPHAVAEHTMALLFLTARFTRHI